MSEIPNWVLNRKLDVILENQNTLAAMIILIKPVGIDRRNRIEEMARHIRDRVTMVKNFRI